MARSKQQARKRKSSTKKRKSEKHDALDAKKVKSDEQVGADERYFLDPKSVSIHLYCSICQEVFSQPQRAPCGHSFCKVCITEWLKHSKTCPEDRKPVRLTDLHQDFILENIIGDQMVACPFRPRGCTHIGPLQMLSWHKKSCTFNPVNLPKFLQTDPAVTPSATASAPGPSTSGLQPANGDSDVDEDALPDAPVPSLKMRLYAAQEKRDLLCNMFEDKNKENSEDG